MEVVYVLYEVDVTTTDMDRIQHQLDITPTQQPCSAKPFLQLIQSQVNHRHFISLEGPTALNFSNMFYISISTQER